ncbi:MAG: ferrous iron transport protein A [Blautia sp.]|nr:ferrous iron transport protein A [Blautia sp.]
MMPITMANPSEEITITRITGKDDTRHHLHELGLVEGDTVTVVSKNGGNIIIQSKGVRLALDEKLASRIHF